jgi:hypothetical protein
MNKQVDEMASCLNGRLMKQKLDKLEVSETAI